tara:strand:- start:66 stop:260 length:195 start_codon:yes stop_codon:yes gene_type:complete
VDGAGFSSIKIRPFHTIIMTTFETLMAEVIAGTLTLADLNIRSVSMNDIQRLTLVMALKITNPS